ncbi:hypothetical protein RRG08_013780 [Elysia crispata]|uniref:Uncharacterized protein n=1 Tax=Elysia crispata TaxID=231223 RepID=A0AAE1A2Z7_9GAST|nr:hypothetical protein RRG08_013780 [Elysia crispata]
MRRKRDMTDKVGWVSSWRSDGNVLRGYSTVSPLPRYDIIPCPPHCPLDDHVIIKWRVARQWLTLRDHQLSLGLWEAET